MGVYMPTTIQIDVQTKEKIKSFGRKGESYQDIINRLYDVAVREQLREFLLSDDAVPIDDAIARAKKRWRS
jgi:hypothetical protein